MKGDKSRKSKDAANENLAAYQRGRSRRTKLDLRNEFEQAADGESTVSVGEGGSVMAPNGENEQNKSSSVEAKASERHMIANEEVEKEIDLEEQPLPPQEPKDLKQEMEETEQELKQVKKDMKLARQRTLELRLRQGLICPESAFSEPASLSLLPRKSMRD